MNSLKKLIGKKCGMTQRFDVNGKIIPCTIIYVEPNVVTQVKTEETDGYNAAQIATQKVPSEDEATQTRKVGKPLMGHFKKAGVAARREMLEIRLLEAPSCQPGEELTVAVFKEGEYLDVIGTSKGKGYQGVMKKFGFKGMGASHGEGPVHRHAGSTGMRSTPGRCLPNSPRASQMGNQRVTVQGLQIIAVQPEKNIIVVKGAVPGPTGATVYIQEAVKKSKATKAA
ncbi:MAG: rplC [Chlamydiales bacterium]|jgi:large subunit ribosomal protein L3|nr:rplC [Chlamydiales bacterium]